jgi:hypothetical protein
MKRPDEKLNHLCISVECPWCGQSRAVYVPMRPTLKRMILVCEDWDKAGCEKSFAFKVHWQAVVEYWRLLPGEDPILGER